MARDEAQEPGRNARGAIWSGTLAFGLVSIPVELYPGVRDTAPSLRMLGPDGTPLQRRFFCPDHSRELSREELVRGYELDDGRTVVVSDQELERVEPRKSREIDLRRFVDVAALDPIYFERAYFLVARAGSDKAYRLLARVLERSGRAGIATFVMRDREYWVAIFAEHGVLCAETLRFADEIRRPDSLARLGTGNGRGKPAGEQAWERAIGALSEPGLDGEDLDDPHARALRALAERKSHERDAVVTRGEAEPEAEGGELIDLVQLLKERLAGKARKHTRRSQPARRRRQSKS